MPAAVHIPWYATLFRADKFELALMEIAPVALRYGATEYQVHRARDDQYKFLQIAYFEEKSQWERYWLGEEFSNWRADYQGWYQVPVVYGLVDVVARGALGTETRRSPGEERSPVG